MTWLPIQSNASINDTGGGDQFQVTAFDAPVTAGNLIVVSVGWSESVDPGTADVTDTLGNVYAPCGPVYTHSANGQNQQTFYAVSIADGSDTVTVTLSANRTFKRMGIAEFSGNSADPYDQSTGQAQTAVGTSTDEVSSGTIAPSVDGCLIYGWTQSTSDSDPGAGDITPGTTYTPTEGDDVTPDVFMGEWAEQATAGSVAATFTLSVSHNMLTSCAVFKPPTPAEIESPIVRNFRSNVPPQIRLG